MVPLWELWAELQFNNRGAMRSLCLPRSSSRSTCSHILSMTSSNNGVKKSWIYSGIQNHLFQRWRGEWPLHWTELICITLQKDLEKAMAPHSSTLIWKIPWTEEPGGLQSMRSLRVGHDWATSLSLFPFMHWRRKWQSTPVFLPGKSQGRGSLVGSRLWGRTELDMTEAT